MRFFYILPIILILHVQSMGDVIYLKDGTKEESNKVWEEGGYVHFILKGTQSVEIRYAKEIVDRIESDRPAPPPTVIQGGEESALSKSVETKALEDNKKSLTASGPTVEKGAVRSFGGDPPPIDPHTQKGAQFYDPRRHMKYWASKDSRHVSYDDALDALAGLYKQPRIWVESHLGETNDLEALHMHLVFALKNDPLAEEADTEPAAVAEKEELSAQIADIGNGDEHPVPSSPTALPVKKVDASELKAYKGLKFYDPRRPKKFWVAKDARYDTLEDALDALGQQYDVSVKWVEAHMGKTNDLSEIHNNLILSIQLKP